MDKKSEILIFGLGSEILTDDGIGTRIANDLAKDHYFEHLDYKTELIFSLDSIDSIVGYKTIIFIDAILTKESQPGELAFCEFDRFQETLHLSNVHEAKFNEFFELWSHIGFDVPKNIYVISIEVKDYLSFGEKLSKQLQETYNENLNMIKSWIHYICHNEDVSVLTNSMLV